VLNHVTQAALITRQACAYRILRREVLSEDNFTEDSERHTKEGSGKGASVSIGTPLGEQEGGSFTGDFERKVKFFFGRSCLVGTPRGIL